MIQTVNSTAEQIFRPASIYALTCGCTLLLCGAITDALGNRRMYLSGTALQAVFTLSCGLSTTTTQLIVFRGLAGIATSFCLPSAVSLITSSFPVGKRRNIAFASMGGGQPVGFGIGLVLGGVLSDTIGWRWGFHITAILNSCVLALTLWAFPSTLEAPLSATTWTRLSQDVDWVGAIISSTCLALLSYVFATITGSDQAIRDPANISLLVVAIALIPAFIWWMGRQAGLGRPALIPNKLWTNIPFTTICIVVLLIWGPFNATEQYTAFYLEYVRGISSTQTSLYFLPAPISGALANILVGVLLPHVNASLVVQMGCVSGVLSTLLLAVFCQVDGPSYWHCVFEAMALNPIAPDFIYTIANLIVTGAFPASTQGVAGGVFNTVAQIGKSIGLATTALVAMRITANADQSAGDDLARKEALLVGYKAGWWYCCALAATAIIVSVGGLRKLGKLGVKMD